MIHFSIGNIFVNPGDTENPNISFDTYLWGLSPCIMIRNGNNNVLNSHLRNVEDFHTALAMCG